MEVSTRYRRYIEYAENVVNKKILACKKTIKSCEMFLKDLEEAELENSVYYFDFEEVDSIIQFIENLSLSDGKWKGQKIKLLDWQCFIVASIYGFYERKTGKRKIQRAFIHIPRKVGKTTLISALMVLALLDEAGAQVYSIATTREQATIAFKKAKDFITNNERLKSIKGIKSLQHRIEYTPTGSVLRALSSDSGTHDGKDPSFILADEIAAYKSDSLINVMMSGTVARESPILIMITTSNFISNSAGYRQYEYLEKYQKGLFEDKEYFGISYELDVDDDWKNIEIYEKAIPSLGHTIEKDTMKKELNRAINDEGYTDEFKVKHLNYWIQGHKDNLIPDKYWKIIRENEEPTEEEIKDLPCFGGLDLSKRNDLTCYSLCWYIPRLDKYYLKHKIYIPENQIELKMKRDSPMIRQWIKKGLIKIAGNETIDYEIIMNDLMLDGQTYNIQTIGYDRAYSSNISELFLAKGISLTEVIQNFTKLNIANRNFEAQAYENRIIDKNDVVYWCIGNAIKYYKGGDSLLLIKKASDTSRIDPVVTSVMSLMLTVSNTEVPQKEKEENTIDQLLKLYGKEI